MRRLARVLGRRLLGALDVDGVLDLAGRRVLACDDRGAWGMVQIEDRVWSGRGGRPIEDRLRSSPPFKIDPLGLLDHVAGLHVPGGDSGPEPGRHVVARTDRGTVEVWLDAGRVRRVSRDDEDDVSTLTLRDGVVDVEALDWTRLPVPTAR